MPSLSVCRRSRLLARLGIAGSWLPFRAQNIRLELLLFAVAMLLCRLSLSPRV